MSLTLYHYIHCPFCVRVRMALGFLGLDYESKVLSYEDESTPVALTGVKMLPILATPERVINESLDIIALVDQQNRLKVQAFVGTQDFAQLEVFLGQLGSLVHSLAMPYWIYTPEFSPTAREYFQKKKEVKRGPFKDLVKKQNEFMRDIKKLLNNLENDLHPFYQSQEFGLKDILIASHIWGLYTVTEFQFSEKVHHYLQNVKALCGFNYHQDLWS